MLDKDRAIESSDSGWELYEKETDDGKDYTSGKSKGKPMKNIVISSKNGPMTVKVELPREAFVEMVKKYFDTKGY